jgi:RHS repeat-associated protein
MTTTANTESREVGLDYFGARYFSGAQGRFTSPDPPVMSLDISNPQSWNKYAYAFNRPLALDDPDGKWPTWFHHQLIEQVFEPVFGRIDLTAVSTLERASDWVDSWANQDPRLSFMHAMSDGKNGQSVEGAELAASSYMEKQEKQVGKTGRKNRKNRSTEKQVGKTGRKNRSA